MLLKQWENTLSTTKCGTSPSYGSHPVGFCDDILNSLKFDTRCDESVVLRGGSLGSAAADVLGRPPVSGTQRAPCAGERVKRELPT